MTATAFGTNDPNTQKIWSEKLFRWMMANCALTQGGLVGDGDNFPIQIDTSLTAKKGDKMTFRIRAPLTGEGVGDGGRVLSAAEALSILNFTLEVHERANCVTSDGAISEQRTAVNIREEGKAALGDWYARRLEEDAYAALAGLYNSPVALTVNEKAPSAARVWRGGQKADGTICAAGPFASDALLSAQTATDVLMGTGIISLIRRKMSLGTAAYPAIRPIMVKGKPYYVCLLHTWQVKAIKNETGDNGWKQIQAAANIRGEENPLFSGALGLWDGVILHEYNWPQMVRTGAGGSLPAEGFTLAADRATTTDPEANGKSVARALFLGAQAGVIGWAMKPKWTESLEDVKRLPAMAYTGIYGVSKTRFSTYTSPSPHDSSVGGTNTAGEDFGVVAVDTCVVPD